MIYKLLVNWFYVLDEKKSTAQYCKEAVLNLFYGGNPNYNLIFIFCCAHYYYFYFTMLQVTQFILESIYVNMIDDYLVPRSIIAKNVLELLNLDHMISFPEIVMYYAIKTELLRYCQLIRYFHYFVRIIVKQISDQN